MSLIIKERTPKKAWEKVILNLLKEGQETAIKDGRKRLFKENIIIEIEQPKEIDELITLLEKQDRWLYPSKEELKDLIMGEKGARNYEYSYGRRIFDFKGLNQIDDYIIPLIQKNPKTTQAIINLWDPKKDAKAEVRDKVSFHSAFFNLKKNKLNLTMIFRSTDFTAGWPANIFQGVSLINHVCKKLNLESGIITTISINGHIYPDNANIIKRELLEWE